MRKTSYVVTFLAVAVTVLLNLLSITRHDWLNARLPETLNTKIVIQYGLFERCESTVMEFPGPGDRGKIAYTDFTCRLFPTRRDDKCESDDNRVFCTLWWTAGYAAELGCFLGAAVLLGIIFGISTRSRRRRIWRAVASLQALHASVKIAVFALITHVYSTYDQGYLQYARPGSAYVMGILSWVMDILIMLGVVVTGLAAEAGHSWAAGGRAYRRIDP